MIRWNRTAVSVVIALGFVLPPFYLLAGCDPRLPFSVNNVTAQDPETVEFFKSNAGDPILDIWSGEERLSSIALFEGINIYEITFDNIRAFENMPGMTPTHTFILYRDKRGRLQRLNAVPMPYVGFAFKHDHSSAAVRAFRQFTDACRIKSEDIPTAKLAGIYVSCVYHNLIGWPCMILSTDDLTRSAPDLTDLQKQLSEHMLKPSGKACRGRTYQVVMYYPPLERYVMYTLSFDSRNKLLSAEAKSLEGIGQAP